MYRLTIVLILIPLLMAGNVHSVERTEAQRYYDLGVSYMKSDLYEKGLDTLNQVAFLYPDSDVADDALYQLARVSYELDDMPGARDLFKRYLEHDKASKWRGEAERYLEVIAPGEEGKKKNESREGSAH